MAILSIVRTGAIGILSCRAFAQTYLAAFCPIMVAKSEASALVNVKRLAMKERLWTFVFDE